MTEIRLLPSTMIWSSIGFFVEERRSPSSPHIRDSVGWGSYPGFLAIGCRVSTPSPSLYQHEQEKGFYLKLHGSLDWFYCLTPGCQNNTSIFPAGVFELSGHYEQRPCRNYL